MEVLTRDNAIPANKSPTGVTYNIVPLAHNPSLFQIVGDKGGLTPEKLEGLWTGTRQAQEAISEYLVKMWNMADEATEEAERNKAKARAAARAKAEKSEEPVEVAA